MEKVLVTGSTGFVGANIVRRLLKENYEVHVITRDSSNMWRLEEVKEVIFDYKVDLKDLIKLTQIVESINPDFIIHLAIYGGRPNQRDATAILENNLLGTINLISAADKVNYKCFINTGSSSEYGRKNTAMREDFVCEPINLYGVTKASSTMFCHYKAYSENKNIGTLRLFSPYGKFEDQGRLIPDLILGSLLNKKIMLANPESVRDFIYIDDVCDIYMKILNDPSKLKGQTFNIGSGKQYSVKDIAETLKNRMFNDVIFNFNAIKGRDADTNIWVSDIKKIKTTYNWEPVIGIIEGIEKSVIWFRDHLDLYNTKEKL